MDCMSGNPSNHGWRGFWIQRRWIDMESARSRLSDFDVVASSFQLFLNEWGLLGEKSAWVFVWKMICAAVESPDAPGAF